MIAAARQLYRNLPGFTRVVMALAGTVVMVGWWMQSAYQASGIGTEPADAACRRMPEAPTSEAIRVTAEWTWFPPGLNCYAGDRLFHSPGWTAVLAPTVIGVAGLVALLAATGMVVFRAALRIRGRKVLLGGAILGLAELIAIGAFPVAFTAAGGLALLWGPFALAVSVGLLLVAGRLLRPPPAEPVTEAPGEAVTAPPA